MRCRRDKLLLSCLERLSGICLIFFFFALYLKQMFLGWLDERLDLEESVSQIRARSPLCLPVIDPPSSFHPEREPIEAEQGYEDPDADQDPEEKLHVTSSKK